MPTTYDNWLDRTAAEEAEDAREEEREEWIAERTEQLIEVRKNDPGSVMGALADLSDDDKAHIVTFAGQFFAEYGTAVKQEWESDIGWMLWRHMLPFVEDTLRYEAEADASREWDKKVANEMNDYDPEAGR